MASSLSKEKLTQFAMLLWSVWASRNAKVWNQVSDTSQQIKARARTMWGDWKSAQQVRIQTRNQRGNNTVATANVWIAVSHPHLEVGKLMLMLHFHHRAESPTLACVLDEQQVRLCMQELVGCTTSWRFTRGKPWVSYKLCSGHNLCSSLM